MRRDGRWLCALLFSVAIASVAAPYYAHLAAPAWQAVARLTALGQPWRITGIEVTPSPDGPGTIVALTAIVTDAQADRTASARVTGKITTGAAIEPALVFWLLVLAWPAAHGRERWLRFAIGVPVFIAVDTATTVLALTHALPWATQVIAGAGDGDTAWDRWAAFLEAGGRFAVVTAVALVTIATVAMLGRWLGERPARAARRTVADAAQDCNRRAL